MQVLAHSIYKRASKPVSITPLVLSQLPIKRVGLTEFTYSRYLVPYLCGYEGLAIFMDADMLCLGDVHELVQSKR
jgi:lipopolysaccharide biosynthesis glycosyltransferase